MTNAALGHPDSASKAELGQVARGGAANLVGAVVSAGTNFVLVLVIARFVPTDEAGRFFAATSLFLVLETLGRLGADLGLIYFIARWRALGRQSAVAVGVRAALAPVLALCLLLSVLILIFAPWLARLIGDDTARSAGTLRILALILPVATLYDVLLGGTRGFGQMRPTVLVEKFLRPAAQLLLVVVSVLAGGHLLGLAWSLPYLGAAVLVALAVRQAVGQTLAAGIAGGTADAAVTGQPAGAAVTGQPAGAAVTGQPAGAREIAAEFWRFSLPRAVAGVAQIVLQRLDIVLVGAIRGPRDAAIYTAATRFLVVGQFINQAISAPVQPRLSAALARGDVTGSTTLFRITTGWLVLASWPVFGIAAVLSPWYVGLFGHNYRSGEVVVVVLALSMLVASGCGLVDSVIIMAGRTSWNLWTTLLALVVNVGLNLALIPHLGLLGAALAWSAAILAANVVPAVLACRGLGIHPLGRSTLAAYAAAGGCYVALPLLARAAGLGLPGMAALLVVVTAGYLAILWRGRELFDLDALLHRRAPELAAGR